MGDELGEAGGAVVGVVGGFVVCVCVCVYLKPYGGFNQLGRWNSNRSTTGHVSRLTTVRVIFRVRVWVCLVVCGLFVGWLAGGWAWWSARLVWGVFLEVVASRFAMGVSYWTRTVIVIAWH